MSVKKKKAAAIKDFFEGQLWEAGKDGEFKFKIIEVIGRKAIVRAKCLRAPDKSKGMLGNIISFLYKDAEKSFKYEVAR